MKSRQNESAFGLNRSVLLLCLAIGFSPLVNAKTYKWVDADGNVHYTQTPPPASAKRSKQLKVNVEKVVRVEKRGRSYYCGNRVLPSNRSRASTEIANLTQRIPDWRAEIERVKERRAEYVKANAGRLDRAHAKKSMSRFESKVAEAKCAIAWAEERLASLDGERAEIVNYHKELQETYDTVLRKKNANCGQDNRQGVIKVDAKYREHQQCIRPYDRELSKIKRQLKSAKREAELVQR
ncbi:MAG: DUF4124 domain-containing protein [Pseudomonadota bacterium]